MIKFTRVRDNKIYPLSEDEIPTWEVIYTPDWNLGHVQLEKVCHVENKGPSQYEYRVYFCPSIVHLKKYLELNSWVLKKIVEGIEQIEEHRFLSPDLIELSEKEKS